MSDLPQKTIISRTFKSTGPDGKLRAYQKTEETIISGNRTTITTSTLGDPAMHQRDDQMIWRSLSPAPSNLTEEVMPRSQSSNSFGDSTLYGDDWSSVTSNKSDRTVVREAQLVTQTNSFRPLSNSSSRSDRPTPASSNASRVTSFAKSDLAKDRPTSVSSNASRVTSYTKNDLAKFRQQALKMHNDYRALHGAAPLQLSEELNAYAQEWAEHLAAKDVFEHRPRESRKCGENLYYGMNTQGVNPEEAIKNWYDEYKNYDFNRPGFASNTGHFTQVVWKESRRLGLGVAQPSPSVIYVVGNYDPPGNIVGADNFRRNVADKK